MSEKNQKANFSSQMKKVNRRRNKIHATDISSELDVYYIEGIYESSFLLISELDIGELKNEYTTEWLNVLDLYVVFFLSSRAQCRLMDQTDRLYH